MGRPAANFSSPYLHLTEGGRRSRQGNVPARLSAGCLLPLQFRFDRSELERLVILSRELRRSVSGGAGTQAALALFSDASQAATFVLYGAKSSPKEIEQWVRALRASLGALIKQINLDGATACRDYIREKVIAMSEQQSLRD
jgi:hypothetical protein